MKIIMIFVNFLLISFSPSKRKARFSCDTRLRGTLKIVLTDDSYSHLVTGWFEQCENRKNILSLTLYVFWMARWQLKIIYISSYTVLCVLVPESRVFLPLALCLSRSFLQLQWGIWCRGVAFAFVYVSVKSPVGKIVNSRTCPYSST